MLKTIYFAKQSGEARTLRWAQNVSPVSLLTRFFSSKTRAINITALKKEQCLPSRTFPEYFTELSANYFKATGNSTFKVISEYLRTATSSSVVDARSIINDNASGPGAATAAIIEHLGQEPESIVANDSVPAMVSALKHRIAALKWRNVHAVDMDSRELKIDDDIFTVSISNICISTYKDPIRCLKEMRRTLRPVCVCLQLILDLTNRFAAAELIHVAQRLVRADAELMKVPKAKFMQEGYLAETVSSAGFRDANTEVVSVLCKDEEIEGLRAFILGDFTRTVRATWTDDEKAKWPGVVDAAINDEVAEFGGVKFEAWVSSRRK